MKNPFTNHPKEVGLNYFSHFFFAIWVASNLLYGLVACLIHAFFPFLFTHSTSSMIDRVQRRIHERMKN